MKHDKETVRLAAAGRWPEILEQVAKIPSELLNGKNHPCPWCGGKDRFSFAWPDAGGCNCRQCHAENNGDGFAAVMRALGCSFPESLNAVGSYLGLVPKSNGKPLDPLSEMARLKRCSVESLKVYQARVVDDEVLVPMFKPPVHGADGKGCPCGWQRFFGDFKGRTKKGSKHGVFLPGKAPEPNETWVALEGVKDAAAVHALGYDAAGYPGNHLPKKCETLFRGCDVIIVPDLDMPSQIGSEKTAASLYRLAASVKIARLPGQVTPSDGRDVRDILQMPDGERQVREAIDHAVEWKPDCHEDLRPTVYLDLNESRLAEQVLQHLGSCGLYQRGGQLVHVTREKSVGGNVQLPDSVPRIRKLPSSILREIITSRIQLMIRGKEEDKPTRPARWLTDAIGDRGEYPSDIFPPLTGIVRSPTIRFDGTVLQDAGYDAASGLLYEPDGEYPRISDNPTREDAQQAAAALMDVICDFPFADAETHKPVWLAMVLTFIARSAIAGPCPLFTIDANTRGSGKSMLGDAAALIAYGHHLARKTWPRDDDEVRKTITSIAIEAIPAVLLDNVSSTLGSSSLDAALTGTTWTDRVLGKSEMTGTLPLSTVWVATGNNIVLGADTARRALLCRIETLARVPQQRGKVSFLGLFLGAELAQVVLRRCRVDEFGAVTSSDEL